MKTACTSWVCILASFAILPPIHAADEQTGAPRATYGNPAHTTVLLDMNGKQYIVDLATQSVREASSSASASQSSAAELFEQNCATCHGADGKGIQQKGTPNFSSPSVQAGLSDRQIVDTIRNGKAPKMPAWSDKLSDAEITGLAAYIRSFGNGSDSAHAAEPQEGASSGIYTPGDDVLVSLPTGRPLDRHGVYVNFSHRFATAPAFTGPSRGAQLFGFDSFSISSFGFRYGATDRLSLSAWRSPSLVGRPIQLMAAYNLLDENREAPLNLAVRVSIEGQNNFEKSFTENIETIFSRSLSGRAQIYVVPTMSFNDRRLVQSSSAARQIADFPGVNALSVGFGAAVDIRPTVALVAEVIPTVLHFEDLGIHRPAYSFGIQKKIWKHAFTLALSNSPGMTVSQRAATRASFLRNPNADTPAGMFFGFDLMRQIH